MSNSTWETRNGVEIQTQGEMGDATIPAFATARVNPAIFKNLVEAKAMLPESARWVNHRSIGWGAVDFKDEHGDNYVPAEWEWYSVDVSLIKVGQLVIHYGLRHGDATMTVTVEPREAVPPVTPLILSDGSTVPTVPTGTPDGVLAWLQTLYDTGASWNVEEHPKDIDIFEDLNAHDLARVVGQWRLALAVCKAHRLCLTTMQCEVHEKWVATPPDTVGLNETILRNKAPLGTLANPNDGGCE